VGACGSTERRSKAMRSRVNMVASGTKSVIGSMQ
jgi:hypothetical protein